MAELTQLESKLGEVMGLAQAAQESTARVIKMVDDDQVAAVLKRHVKDMRDGSLKLAAQEDPMEPERRTTS